MIFVRQSFMYTLSMVVSVTSSILLSVETHLPNLLPMPISYMFFVGTNPMEDLEDLPKLEL